MDPFLPQGFHENLKRIEIIGNTVHRRGRPETDVAVHSLLPFPGYAFSVVVKR